MSATYRDATQADIDAQIAVLEAHAAKYSAMVATETNPVAVENLGGIVRSSLAMAERLRQATPAEMCSRCHRQLANGYDGMCCECYGR